MFLRALLVATVMTASLVAGQVSAGPATAGPVPDRTAATYVPVPGPGWYLALVDHGRPGDYGIEPSRQRLELVDPDGAESRILGVDVGRHGRGSAQLVDWSTDGSTALLLVDPGLRSQHAVIVDVATGATTTVPLGERVSSVLLDGSDTLLVTGWTNGGDGGAPLWRIDLAGGRSRLAARVDGSILPSPDGSTIVTGTRDWSGHGVRVLDRDGRVRQRMATSTHCTPVRWWDRSRVELRCWSRRSLTLSLADVATGEVSALTHPHGKDSADLGDVDARRIDSGLYLQASGPCGYYFLAHQLRDGSVEPVKVPHAVGNVLLVAGEGHELVVEHAVSCDGAAPRSALGRFDPVTHEERVLTLLPENEAFDRILPYGERQASAY